MIPGPWPLFLWERGFFLGSPIDGRSGLTCGGRGPHPRPLSHGERGELVLSFDGRGGLSCGGRGRCQSFFHEGHEGREEKVYPRMGTNFHEWGWVEGAARPVLGEELEVTGRKGALAVRQRDPDPVSSEEFRPFGKLREKWTWGLGNQVRVRRLMPDAFHFGWLTRADRSQVAWHGRNGGSLAGAGFKPAPTFISHLQWTAIPFGGLVDIREYSWIIYAAISHGRQVDDYY